MVSYRCLLPVSSLIVVDTQHVQTGISTGPAARGTRVPLAGEELGRSDGSPRAFSLVMDMLS